MYACPNCAGHLTFDIKTQKLRCVHCDTQLDPYEYQKEHDAEEREDFGVTVFHCPQCGAEIFSTDEAVTGFCSYCGASTIFDTRLRDEKKPDYIIPFVKTKQDCQSAYRSMLRRALYAPKELRDPAFIERATGIYMPYWVYEFQLNDEPKLRANANRREGDYVIEGAYEMSGHLKGEYMMSYDASSFFHDRISESIAPYPVRELKPFTPSFLSGFYADTADVDAEVYLQDAKNHVGNDAYKRFTETGYFRDVSPMEISHAAQMNWLFSLDDVRPKRALFPVWFLTWRKKDRVAYAVMNGKTGKLMADMPISAGRFLAGSALTAIPFFILYTMFLTLTPSFALTMAGIVALLFDILFLWLMHCDAQKRNLENDAGVAARRHTDAGGNVKNIPVKSEFIPPKLSFSARRRGYTAGTGAVSMLACAACIVMYPMMTWVQNGGPSRRSYYGYSASPDAWMETAGILLLMAALVLGSSFFYQTHASRNVYAFLTGLPVFAAPFLVAVVLNRQPVSDLPYYFAITAVLACAALSFCGQIHLYNRLVTDPAPRLFQREGGDAT